MIKLTVDVLNLDLNQHIEFKNKELKNLRFLAKATLHQKSVLDNFLMESIECAKQGGDEFEVQQDADKKSMRATQSERIKHQRDNMPTPENQSQDQSERPGHEGNKLQIGKTELKDLSWEDREKILRVIFTKISLGVSPGYWKRIEAEAERKRRKEEGHFSPLQRTNGLN